MKSFMLKDGKELMQNLTVEDITRAVRQRDGVLWVDLDMNTPSDVAMLKDVWSFHPLAIEDATAEILSPKVDIYGDYLFMVVHAPNFAQKEEVGTYQIDLFVGKNYIVTTHKQPVPVLTLMEERLKKYPEISMGRGSEFLLHGIIDAIVDSYQSLLEFLDQTVSILEDEIFADPSQDYMGAIFDLKKDVIYLLRVLRPQRDIINKLSRGEFPFLSGQSLMYFRDVYDHINRVCENLEGFRDVTAGVQDAYLMAVSNRMNQIVKTLTIIATIMMPLTLITGIYGMNFNNMPELGWRFGYFVVMGGMLGLTLLMLWYFKRRRWL
ncbi:MAG: magnesium/cobalt transporter CorA [Candidatus Hydrogenedentota bacterium]|nr:MAG: magnesium/cobalt transporter CorA [Candidatus Hydrogenedentota bacterium]